MADVQKRRFVNCLAEHSEELSLAYVAFSRDDLLSLENNHRLYEGDILGVPADIACIGLSYAELYGQVVEEIESADTQLTIDRFISAKQSDQICRIVREYQGDCTVHHESSHQERGIQTADCFAGAVSETLTGNESWLYAIDGSIDASDFALAHIQKALTDI